MKTFKDKTVLITGASRGIGREFAKVLAPLGAHLILTARTESDLEVLAKELAKTHGTRTHVFTENLAEEAAPKRLFDSVKAKGLQVDCLINNAGFGWTGKSLECERDTYEKMLRVNVSALVELTHLFLPGMLEKRDGGIINIASTAAFQPVPHLSVYAATKAFVLSFTQGLAGEYGQSASGVTFLCLSPGATETDFQRVARMDMKRSITGKRQGARQVAEIGIRAFLQGRQTAVTSPMNFFLANSTRFVPRKLALDIAGSLFRSRSGNT